MSRASFINLTVLKLARELNPSWAVHKDYEFNKLLLFNFIAQGMNGF